MTFDITESVVTTLGPEASAAASWENSDVAYDFAVAGLPFLSAVSERNPYERALAQVQKQQFDQSQDPGEQSLGQWWSRSQADWSGGAGSEFMEPSSDELVMRSFWRSEGVDPWTAGKLSLLAETEQKATVGTSGTTSGMSTDGYYLYTWIDASLKRWRPESSYTPTSCTMGGGAFPSNIVDVQCGGGRTLVRCANGTIYAAAVGATDFSAVWTSAGSGVMRFVKQRWVITSGSAVYYGAVPSVVPVALSSSLTLAYTHPATYSTPFVGIADGPDCIFIGYGNNIFDNGVLAFTVSDSGSVVAMSSGRTVAELPAGELLYEVETYLGSYVILVTNRGVRIGYVGSNGQITYGPLSFESDATTVNGDRAYGPVLRYDRFVYVMLERNGGLGAPAVLRYERGGLIRFDLGAVGEDGRAPWAYDVLVGDANTDGYGTGMVSAAVFAPDTVYFMANPNPSGTTTLYLYGPSGDRVPEGWVESGWVRYGTLEDKNFVALRVQCLPTFDGTVGAARIDRAEVETSLGAFASGPDVLSFDVNTDPAQRLRVKLTLTRDAGDATSGPTLDGWQLRALPAVRRQQLIQVPLLCFDFERDQRGVMVGFEGSALARYQALLEAVKDGPTVRLQDLNSGEVLTVVVEDLSFRTGSLSEIASGFGGIVQVTARSV